MIRAHFGQKVPFSVTPPPIPDFPVPSHEEARFSCFVESEAGGVSTLDSVYVCLCTCISYTYLLSIHRCHHSCTQCHDALN